jgi:hypothetical protein
MKSHISPPRWAELILERLLASQDRQTVTGDLREEYAEAILPYMGRLAANLWYLRQVISFFPRCTSERGSLGRILLLSSVFTLICDCWLVDMEWLQRHPGFLLRITLDASIALAALATVLVRLLHLGIGAERWLWVAAIALIGIAVQAFANNARSADFEGFALIISLALMFQGILMLVSLGRAEKGSHSSARRTGGSQ